MWGSRDHMTIWDPGKKPPYPLYYPSSLQLPKGPFPNKTIKEGRKERRERERERGGRKEKRKEEERGEERERY